LLFFKACSFFKIYFSLPLSHFALAAKRTYFAVKRRSRGKGLPANPYKTIYLENIHPP
jgi:hypothetical protein